MTREQRLMHNQGMRVARYSFVLAFFAFWLMLAAVADQKGYLAPKVFHANTYPARDDHPMEHVSIAVDPYDLPDKTAGVFKVPYKEAGFLPMRLVISNDGDAPVALVGMNVELVTVKKTKLQPVTPDDIYRRISKQSHRPDEPRTIPLPIPRKQKPSVSKEAQEEIESSRFLAKAVEPHSTQAGFLFFDVSGISQPMAGAHLYVTGVHDASGQELMYFDIPLENYLGYQPGH